MGRISWDSPFHYLKVPKRNAFCCMSLLQKVTLSCLFCSLLWCWSDTLKGDHFSIDVASLVLQGIVTSFCGHSLPASCEHLTFLGLNFMSHHLSQSSSASMSFFKSLNVAFFPLGRYIGKEEAGAKDWPLGYPGPYCGLLGFTPLNDYRSASASQEVFNPQVYSSIDSIVL